MFVFLRHLYWCTVCKVEILMKRKEIAHPKINILSFTHLQQTSTFDVHANFCHVQFFQVLKKSNF